MIKRDIEMKFLLSYAKYPVWTAWRYVTDTSLALRNTRIVFAAFWRTIYIGIVHRRSAMRVLKKHRQTWSASTRGRYMWRVARRFWAQWILDRADLLINPVGFERVDWTRPHIIVANHQSTIDILLSAALIPNGRIVAKKEVLKFPIIGSACSAGAQILIDREDHLQSMLAIRKGMQEWRKCNLIFFAEGTRTRTGKLGGFKKGAFAVAKETGIPILPIAISGTYEALPKGSLLRLKKRPHITVVFGREINENSGDVLSLARRARNEIRGMLNAASSAII